MLNADDQFTPASLNQLKEVIRQNRPLIIWIGAGASRWANLPSWHDSARMMRNVFSKNVSKFPNDIASHYLDINAYPDLFQLCQEADLHLYHKTLLTQFTSPSLTPLYNQLIKSLSKITPVQVLTTNIDLCLEQSLGTIDLIENSDIERCTDSIVNKRPFIAKLHGSVSTITSTVFSSSDYNKIINDKKFIAAMKSIFTISSTLFLGYGLQDQYIINLLNENDSEHIIFGTGPHFLITSQATPPENGVYKIGYDTTLHQDHRAALTILNIIDQEIHPTIIVDPPTPPLTTLPNNESGFYISHFVPSGTHITGQYLTLNNSENNPINAIIGLGFVQGELPSSETVAFHDLAVGLTCFDRVYLPLSALGTFCSKVTLDVFWPLMASHAIKFIDIIHNPFFVITPGNITGDIGIARIQDPDETETRSSMSIVNKMLQPAPGKEAIGQAQIDSLFPHIIQFNSSQSLNLPGMVRNALLLPRVSRLLGYSDYITSNAIPIWLAHPTLRFAHLVQTGLICNQLNIRSVRVPFGGQSLLSAAFGIKPGEHTVLDYASFVMSGAFGSNLSSYIENFPLTLLNILKFRETTEGIQLRREIADRLQTNDGTEFSTAIEGSLRQSIPYAVLQASRNKFSSLVKANTHLANADAIWADKNTGDASLCLWREQSKRLLINQARSLGIHPNDQCICGSGDPLKNCCMKPLK